MPGNTPAGNADRTSGEDRRKIPARRWISSEGRTTIPLWGQGYWSNRSNVEPVVYTVCPAPSGPVAPGRWREARPMSVAHVANGPVTRGRRARSTPGSIRTRSGTRPNMLKFTEYGAEQTIPTGVRVPCDGTARPSSTPARTWAPCVSAPPRTSSRSSSSTSRLVTTVLHPLRVVRSSAHRASTRANHLGTPLGSG